MAPCRHMSDHYRYMRSIVEYQQRKKTTTNQIKRTFSLNKRCVYLWNISKTIANVNVPLDIHWGKKRSTTTIASTKQFELFVLSPHMMYDDCTHVELPLNTQFLIIWIIIVIFFSQNWIVSFFIQTARIECSLIIWTIFCCSFRHYIKSKTNHW